MATASGGTAAPVTEPPPRGARLTDANGAPASPVVPAPRSFHGVEKRLFTEGFAFDFFQAVRLLEKLAPDRKPVGQDPFGEGTRIEDAVNRRKEHGCHAAGQPLPLHDITRVFVVCPVLDDELDLVGR